MPEASLTTVPLAAQGRTPLQLATDAAVVRALVGAGATASGDETEGGAEVAVGGLSPGERLRRAAARGDLDTLQVMLAKHGAGARHTPLL